MARPRPRPPGSCSCSFLSRKELSMTIPYRARVNERWFLNLPGFHGGAYVMAFVEATSACGPRYLPDCDDDCPNEQTDDFSSGKTLRPSRRRHIASEPRRNLT